MRNNNFQTLNKSQQRSIIAGQPLCTGSYAGKRFTIIEINGYYFAKIQGVEEEKIQLTQIEAADTCAAFTL